MIEIIYFEENLDNWGRKETSNHPKRIYEALVNSEEWNDDMIFSDPSGQIYFIDDLIGKTISVEGYQPFTLSESE